MADETFTSGRKTHKMTVYPAPVDSKRHPMILLAHGNFGMGPPYGDQIRSFGKSLADLGYVTAVPQFYEDDNPHTNDTDPNPYLATLSDAIAMVAARPDADPGRLGLIGFSLGAAAAMTFIASNAPGQVKALADFFGPLTTAIRAGVGKFPPTIIFHNKNDRIVPVGDSVELNRILPSTIDHPFITYDELWQDVNHAFQPGGEADRDSRKKANDWFVAHIPPVGR